MESAEAVGKAVPAKMTHSQLRNLPCIPVNVLHGDQMQSVGAHTEEQNAQCLAQLAEMKC